MSILISCETGGERVPEPIAAALAQRDAKRSRDNRSTASASDIAPDVRSLNRDSLRLAGDSVARHAARRLGKSLHATVIEHEYSPQLIDVSKSIGHRHLYSSLTRSLGDADRRWLAEHLHAPYLERLRRQLAGQLIRYPYVIHLAIRSFTLVSGGKHRRGDVGLAYDPAVQDEVDFCLDWIEEMYFDLPMLKVRRNYPRRGTADGITRTMRATFAGQHYVGIEIQLNRAWASRAVAVRDQVLDGMANCLAEVTQDCNLDAA